MDESSLLKKNPNALGGCVYYSQNREDLTLASFFHDVRKGFYVDVGAYDPDYDSVTKLFYLQGWHGINIEPQLAGYERFKTSRKRDVNLNIGISSRAQDLKLRTYASGGLSTFSEKVKHQYEAKPDEDTKKFKEITVRVRPLRDVFAEYKVGHIDFMKVDVEGYEYEVLESNDWKKYRPEVLCIEANHIEHDWRPLLKEAAYEFVFNDNLNDYYVDKKTDRKRHFNFIKDVINDRGGGIKIEYYEQLNGLYEYARDKKHHVEELDRLATKLAKRVQELEQELHQYDSIKVTARHLNRLVKRNAKSHLKKDE